MYNMYSIDPMSNLYQSQLCLSICYCNIVSSKMSTAFQASTLNATESNTSMGKIKTTFLVLNILPLSKLEFLFGCSSLLKSVLQDP